MAYVIKMPKLGLEMEQGTVLEWYFESGEEVAEGDDIAEVESEKSIGVVEAREDGVIRKIYSDEGDSVPPGTPIGILAAADADISDLEAEVEAELGGEPAEAAVAETGAADTAEEPATSATAAAGDDGTAAAGEAASETSGAVMEDVKASPRAEKRATDLGVDLSTVEGTGFDGAITAEDVEAAADTAEPAETAVKASPRAKRRAEELGVDLTTVDGTGFEGSITQEDVEAAATATPPAAQSEGGGVRRIDASDPAVERYQTVTAVADPSQGEALFETMEAVRSAFEERVTMTDVLVVIASAALEDRPLLNGTYAEATHQVQESTDIAIVGDLDDDASTEVLRNVGEMSLSDVVEARQAGDSVDESVESPPTFTLANATAADAEGRLINPPAVAALELDPAGQRAIPGDDGVDLQRLVPARLTYDTRAVDSATAQAFLVAFFEHAERAPEHVLGSYRGKE